MRRMFQEWLLFSRQVMSDFLRPHGLQHSRLPCSSPSPGVCSSSCPLNWWCHPTISSSNALFSFWSLQSFPESGCFPMSQLLASGGQSIGALASVLPKSIQGWFPLGSTGWSPCSPRDFQEFSPAPQLESNNSLVLYLLYGPAFMSIHDNWKDHSLDYMDLCWQSDVFAF